jgi:hypothetical protein
MHQIIERPLRDDTRPAAPANAPERPAGCAGDRAGESTASMIWAGVLLGAVGLFIFNVVFGPIAIGLGVSALKRGVRPGAGRVMALASVVLGVADVVVLLVLAAVSLSRGALSWNLAL